MRMYISVTDKEEYEFLRENQCREVNFWRPGKQAFRALYENELFLFKLRSPENYIVGGGYFVRYSCLPAPLVWDIFGASNGTSSYADLSHKIRKYRIKHNISRDDNQIGCVMLTDVFYFDKEDWIPAPDDFSMAIVQGKGYRTERGAGKELYQKVQANLEKMKNQEEGQNGNTHIAGDGAFKVLVTDAYDRRCAITGEDILPILKPVYIKPVSDGGLNVVNNGILLRADLAGLYSAGYLTINRNYVVKVSKRLTEDYGSGGEYFRYHGKSLMVRPQNFIHLPDREYLDWHEQFVYLG